MFGCTLTDSVLGPLEVSYPLLSSGLEKPFDEAMKALGINAVPEPARTFPCSAHR